MKKIRFLLLIVLLPLIGYSQTPTGSPTTWQQQKGKIGADSGVVNTLVDTFSRTQPIGTERLNKADSNKYVWLGTYWKKLSGSSAGSGSYVFVSPLSESGGSVSINLSSYATTSALTSGLATKQNTLGYTAESTSNKTTDVNGTSNALYPTQGAVKTYVDAVRTALVDSSTVLRALASTSSTDTVSLSNRINQRVKYVDTALMLFPYVLKTKENADSLALANAINARVKYTDTAAMLVGYVRKEDTASLLSHYATKANLADTSAALRSLISMGGTDTSSLSTRINARVKYTDTAAMLSPYLRSALGMKYTDTSTLSARINLKVSSADTAAMLSPYARKTLVSDTASAIRAAIPSVTGKLNTSDTAAMLGPYARKSLLADTAAAIRAAFPSVATKQNYTDTSTWDATKKNLADTAAALRTAIGGGGGGGTTINPTDNYLPKRSNSTTFVNSLFFDNGTFAAIGTTSQYTFGAPLLTVNGATAQVDPGTGKALVSGYNGGNTSFYIQPYGAKLMLNPDGNAVSVNTYTFASGAALTVSGPALIGAMTTANINAISSPATGLQVYDTDIKRIKTYDGSAWRYSPNVYTGTAAPSTTPLAVGDTFIDTSAQKAYSATGTSSSADWKILN